MHHILDCGLAAAAGDGDEWAFVLLSVIGTQQTQGPNQNIILTESKQVDFGMTTMGIALQAWEGKEAWTQGKQYRNIRAMFPMYDTPFHFVTLEKV